MLSDTHHLLDKKGNRPSRGCMLYGLLKFLLHVRGHTTCRREVPWKAGSVSAVTFVEEKCAAGDHLSYTKASFSWLHSFSALSRKTKSGDIISGHQKEIAAFMSDRFSKEAAGDLSFKWASPRTRSHQASKHSGSVQDKLRLHIAKVTRSCCKSPTGA